MGSNVSNERKTPVTNNAKAMPLPRAFDRDANEEVARNHKSLSDDQANVIDIIRPPSILNHSAKINRVIFFHSFAGWREYFQASRHSDKLIIIFFSATWCGFCRYMEPILNDLASQYTDVEIHKIDVDELHEISREFRVYAMPTFLFMKRGKEIDKVIGTRHEDIRRKIENYRV